MTTTLVLGATGATGKHVVRQLLEKGHTVRAIARSKTKMLELLTDVTQERLTIIEGSALDMSNEELEDCVQGCDAVVSCLGHNLTFSGVYGNPRKLVTDTAKRLCETIQKRQSSTPVKFILMGTVGAANPDGSDNIRSLSERITLTALRWLLPPHNDNEQAAVYLSNNIGRENPCIEWVVVRPDNLLDGEVSEYEIFDKPQASLFSGAETTRANVAAFICKLILNEDEGTWEEWKYRMPVVQNLSK